MIINWERTFVNHDHIEDVAIHVHDTASGTEKRESYDCVHSNNGTTYKDHSDRASITDHVRSVGPECHRTIPGKKMGVYVLSV